MEIVIASANVHKIRELREMLKAYKAFNNLDITSILNFPNYQAQPENRSSFKDIAEQKALHAAQTLNKWVISDDSGLIIPALKGEPGVLSARYAGPNASDAENRAKLLLKMQHLDDVDRVGYFECCLSLASPEGIKKTVSGKCEGYILTEEKGRNGFGYDSLFVKNDYDKTFSELGEQIKNKVSHRCKAVEKLVPTLESLLLKLK